jgi:hypothetical protein
MHYLLPTIKKGITKFVSESTPNYIYIYIYIYISFDNIYAKFEVYLLRIFTNSMLETRIWICIEDSISYLFAIK